MSSTARRSVVATLAAVVLSGIAAQPAGAVSAPTALTSSTTPGGPAASAAPSAPAPWRTLPSPPVQPRSAIPWQSVGPGWSVL